MFIFFDDGYEGKQPVVWKEYQFKHIHLTSIQKQVLTTYTNLSRFFFLGTTPVLAPNVWADENPKVVNRSRESNSGHFDCEADAVPHDHGHHGKNIVRSTS